MLRSLVALVAVCLGSVNAGGGIPALDANIILGDRFLGAIADAGEQDAVEFVGLAGEPVSFSIKPKGKTDLVLELLLERTDDPGVALASSTPKGKGASLLHTLPDDGAYRLIVVGAAGSGPYTLNTKTKLKKLEIPFAGNQVDVFAREGVRVTASLTAPLESVWDLLLEPLDPAGPAESLAPLLKGKPEVQARLKALPMVADGTYRFAVTGAASFLCPNKKSLDPQCLLLAKEKRKRVTHAEPGSGLGLKKPLVTSLALGQDGPFYPSQEVDVLVGVGTKKALDLPLVFVLANAAEIESVTADGGPVTPELKFVLDTVLIAATKGGGPRLVRIQLPEPGQIETGIDWRLFVVVDQRETLTTNQPTGFYGELWLDIPVSPAPEGGGWFDFELSSVSTPFDEIDLFPDEVDASEGVLPNGDPVADHKNPLFPMMVSMRKTPGLAAGERVELSASFFDVSFGGHVDLELWGEPADSPGSDPEWTDRILVAPSLDLEPNEFFTSRFHVTVPEGALAQMMAETVVIPEEIEVTARLFDSPTGEDEVLFDVDPGTDDNAKSLAVSFVPPGVEVFGEEVDGGAPSSFAYVFSETFDIPNHPGLNSLLTPPTQHIVKGGGAGTLAGELSDGGFFGELSASGCSTFPFASSEPGWSAWGGVEPSDEILFCGTAYSLLDIATDDLVEPFKFILRIDLLDDTVLAVDLPQDLPNPSNFDFEETWEFCFDLSQDFDISVPGKKKKKSRAMFGGVEFRINFVIEGCSTTTLTAAGTQNFDKAPELVELGLDVGFENREVVTLAIVLEVGLLKNIIYVGGEIVITVFDLTYGQDNGFALESGLLPQPYVQFAAQLDVTRSLKIGAAAVNIVVEIPDTSIECDLAGGFFPICDIVESDFDRLLEFQVLAMEPFFEDDMTVSKTILMGL